MWFRLAFSADTPQSRPVHPWMFEQKGLVVDHCLEQFLLVEDDMHVTIQKDHPHGQGLTTVSHVQLELADVSRICYRLQRRVQIVPSQCTKRRLMKPRRRPARAVVAAQPATRAELADSV